MQDLAAARSAAASTSTSAPAASSTTADFWRMNNIPVFRKRITAREFLSTPHRGTKPNGRDPDQHDADYDEKCYHVVYSIHEAKLQGSTNEGRTASPSVVRPL
jgi:hypothetical protein